jgi:hypothetical protein
VIVTDRALGRLLNLIGGVLLLPLGRYYRLVPDAGASALAKAQAWLHIIGAITFPIGIALVTTQGEKLVSVPHPGFAGRERAVVCSRRSCSGPAKPEAKSRTSSHFRAYPWHSQGNRFARANWRETREEICLKP